MKQATDFLEFVPFWKEGKSTHKSPAVTFKSTFVGILRCEKQPKELYQKFVSLLCGCGGGRMQGIQKIKRENLGERFDWWNV